MRSINLLKLSLLSLVVPLIGCLDSKSAVPDSDINGTWYVSYEVPNSMHYQLPLFVKIDADLLSDQTGAAHLGGDLNSRLSEGYINNGTVKFRWAYHKPGHTLWDHVFLGEYRIDEDGNELLEGTLTGNELNNDCVYPVPPNPEEVQKSAIKDCPRHNVKGTWRARRDTATK